MMRSSILAVVSATVVVVATQVRAETAEAVKKQIHEKVSAYRTIQYKVHMETTVQTPQMSLKSTMEMSAYYMKKGDKVLSRVENKTSATTKFGATQQTMETSSLDVSDGERHYTYTDAGGQKTATKKKINPKGEPSPFDAMAGFAMTEKYQTLKLLADETVDGKPAYVFELVPKVAAGADSVGKTKLYYDKASGLSVKSVSYDGEGKVTSTSTTTDIKINASIPPERFVFKAPHGVTVVDASEGH